MSLSRAASALWRRAPVWRGTAIGAVALTALAAVAGFSGGRSSSGGGGGAVANGAGGGAPPPLALSSAVCAPAGSPTLQAPMVATQGGGVPANVVAVGGGSQQGPSADAQARFTRFSSVVEAARRELRAGERCVKMKDAIGLLETADFAWAGCFPDGPAKLAEAQACAADFAASEVRFDRLIAAREAARTDESAGQIARLADARTAMNPSFDGTRERWAEVAEAVRAGDAATGRIADSDARIAALVRAAAASPQTTATLAALAEAGRTIGPLERGRMTQAQEAMLADAAAAAERIASSDRRLAALRAALAARNAADPASRGALIGAVSRLEAFDAARATPEQATAIAEARTGATGFALEDLVRAADGFDPQTAPPAAFERLRDLRALALGQGGGGPPDPAQTAALAAASLAAARLEQSDQRLAALRETAAAAKRGGPAAMGPEVRRAFDAIADFDRARMDDADQAAYADLRAARDVAVATEQRVLTRDVPLFVTADRDDALTGQAADRLRERLRSEGFRIAPTREGSAVTLTLSRGEVARKKVTIGLTRIETSELRLGLQGRWTFAGDELPALEASGDSSGGDPETATRQAIGEAVEELAAGIGKLAEGK
jgi:hypothetical protein